MVRRAGDREKMVSGWGGISTGGDGQLVQTVRESWENGRNSWREVERDGSGIRQGTGAGGEENPKREFKCVEDLLVEEIGESGRGGIFGLGDWRRICSSNSVGCRTFGTGRGSGSCG